MNATEVEVRDRYLTLLRQALTFTLWEEPPMPVEVLNSLRSPVKRWIVSRLSDLLRRRNLVLAKDTKPTWNDRRDGDVWPASAHTMMGLTRLSHLQHCVETVLREGVDGDFIETGTWRGGGCIMMKAVLVAHGVKGRKVFVADSFQGFPEPEAPQDAGTESIPYLAVSEAEVRRNFDRYALLDDDVVFVNGWFRDTLPSLPVNHLALLRLDGDMYDSTIIALESLYPRLTPGGFCVIDDYGCLTSCRDAVTDFRVKHDISTPLEKIDWTGVFWRKAP